MTPLARLCRARGVTSVLDVVEVSEHLKPGTRVLSTGTRARARDATPRLFDGVTVITAGLEPRTAPRAARARW